MKNLFKNLVLNTLLITISFSVFAQEKATENNTLSAYYDVKNALIAGQANAVASKATGLIGAIKADENIKAQKTLTDKIVFDAEHIAESKDIDHQRDHFASLSTSMYALAKAVKLSQAPIYQAYCPMKKSYWLSNEAPIKNPYFGNKMLTCGKVANTINN